MCTKRQADGDHPQLSWPDAYGSVYRDCVPDSLLEHLLQEAPAVASCPNYWTPKSKIGARGPCTACEAAIGVLYNSVMRHQLPDNWAGAEWWVQVYEQGKGLAFHFDKDEHLFKQEQRMHHPLLSSILYLTGPTFPKRLGPTVIVDQRFDNGQMRALPEDPQRCAVVYPRRGAFAVFDGGLGHGVLGSAAAGLRATLLINWWPHQPQDVSAITAEQAAARSLQIQSWPGTPSTDGSVSAASATLQPPECQVPDQQAVESDSSRGAAAVARGTGLNAGAEDSYRMAGAGVSGSVNGRESSAVCAQPLPVLRLPAAETASGIISVDDLLYMNNLSLVGSSAVDSVAVDHKGWALYPLGDESQQELANEEAPMQTAAVFVPLHMMPAASESESDTAEED
ncbi:hypothetical protein COCOBI_01-8530 [Coccomyxa sp. Obi]|nr:hypothetical protein COCOBI_01-8530 [Coccomyxa sp. Obi]